MLLIIFNISIYNVESQTTYLSGTGTNNCGTTAATSGNNSTFIGCGAGYGGGNGGSARNSFLGNYCGFNATSLDANVGVGYGTLYTLSGFATHDSTFNVAVGNYALYTVNPSTYPVTDGIKNTAIGHKALFLNTTGKNNTAGGFMSLASNTSANNNTAFGYLALSSAAGAYDTENTAIGYQALTNLNGTSNGGLTAVGSNALYSIVNGASQSTALGINALYSTSGKGPNTAVGSNALYSNDGSNNTAVGSDALYFNPTGNNNSVFGYAAGKGVTGNSYSNNSFFGYQSGMGITTGGYNTFAGSLSGVANTTGYDNVFTGYQSGNANTTGHDNVFSGYQAGYNNTTGFNNTFIGGGALNTTGYYNTFLGYVAGHKNTTGINNTFTGYKAGYNNTTGSYNTFYGDFAGYYNFITGNYNTFIGYGADENGNYTNSTAIGNGAIVNANYKIRLGDVNVTALEGNPAAYVSTSDGRFKFNIQENVKGLEFIMKLRPITYQMNTKAFDDFLIQNMPDSIKLIHQQGMDFVSSKAIIHTGFIAQDVDSVANQIGYNFDGIYKPKNINDNYGLAYSQFVVPIIKAMQEQQEMIDSLKIAMSALTSTNKNMQVSDSTRRGFTEANIQQVDLTNNDAILYQNIPNPFGSETTINYYLPENVNNAKMVFYDETGKVIKETELNEKGNGSVVVNAANLRSGIYSYSMVVNEKIIDTKRMQRLK